MALELLAGLQREQNTVLPVGIDVCAATINSSSSEQPWRSPTSSCLATDWILNWTHYTRFPTKRQTEGRLWAGAAICPTGKVVVPYSPRAAGVRLPLSVGGGVALVARIFSKERISQWTG